MAQGLAGVEIAERTGYTVVQVSRLRRRFAEHGVAGLQERSRSGRPPTITARKRAEIVALTLKPPAPGVTQWNSHPTPFVRTKDPAAIVKKAVRRCR